MKIFQRLLPLFLLLGAFSPLFSVAQEKTDVMKQIPIYIFSRKDCGHCAKEEEFLKRLSQKDSSIITFRLDISDEVHRAEWSEIARLHGLSLVTPITLVGNTVIQGFDSSETTGKRIEQIIQNSRGKEILSPREMIARGRTETVESFEGSTCTDDSEFCSPPNQQPLIISLPLLGAIDLGTYSLPLLSVILGFVDGFNPCAMWVLVTFLLILTQARSRKRMFLIAGIFIFSEALLYWLILNLWFTTWDFVALDRIVTPIIGLLALIGGAFFLYEWSQATGTCKIIGASTREKFMRRIYSISSAPIGITMILGVITLSFSVNVIEFACSIGIPQAFTKILELNNLNFIQEQSLMGTYILFYMLDDIVVFFLALWSIQKLGLTTRYTVWTNLIGGILMVLLGLLFIFSPETLRFL